jgi:uncharacterized protein with PQ loop repeat
MAAMGGVYQYIGIGFGGLFLLPQILHGYRSGSLRDVSTTMLVFVVIGSGLWGFYMYESGLQLYMYATGFLCLNAVTLILMQLWQYYLRFKEHVSTFEQKPKKAEIKPAPALDPVPLPSIILEVKDSVKEIKTAPDIVESNEKNNEENV